MMRMMTHLSGLMTGSRRSSTREKTPRTTQYLSQAPALSGDPWRTDLRDMKAGYTTPTRVRGMSVVRSMAALCGRESEEHRV